MPDTVIKVENLSKQYRIGSVQEGYKTFRETLVDAAKAPFLRLGGAMSKALSAKRSSPDSMRHAPGAMRSSQGDDLIWALKNVSFEVKQGEVVGIIGRNGAGKSTLLKILSKITEPTKGRVELRGRVGSLLEVGTGFHPELTGHENVYLYGAILGMDRWEITRKFDEIIAFAELEKFIETPVKRYSSGMYMRLAFAVAAHLEPEILLVDEVLAVGDVAFQKKCLGKMDKVSGEGMAVLFVSHNMHAVNSICRSGILLEDGEIQSAGPVHKVVAYYLDGITKMSATGTDISQRKDRSGTGDMFLTRFFIRDEEGNQIEQIKNGQTVHLVFDYETKSNQQVKNIEFQIVVREESGELIFQFGTRFKGQKIKNVPPQGQLVCELKKFPLVPGRFRLDTYLEVEGTPSDYVLWLSHIDVVDGDYYKSGYRVFDHESKYLVDGSVYIIEPTNS